MKRTWRAAVTCAAVGAAMLGGTGAAQAAPAETGFSFTAEEYDAVPFGTDRATVWQTVVGAPQSPPPGSAGGWCENSGATITCFTESGDYVPYAHFTFDANGRLYSKQQEGLHEPKAPSMTLAQYDKVQLGMTETQFWSVVPKDTCAVRGESYPQWPVTSGHKLGYACTASRLLFPPVAYVDLTDGKVTYKYQRALG